jgi:hypothetical protein
MDKGQRVVEEKLDQAHPDLRPEMSFRSLPRIRFVSNKDYHKTDRRNGKFSLTPKELFGHIGQADADRESGKGGPTMDVILAGHNIDYEIIREIAAQHPERRDLTPETVAAAYARISRNPRPVNELRMIARAEVEKARASNRNIVFEMGHSSIAEHAVLNLDILKVSRLLVEEIEKFRLVSYTEKSQRYITLEDDFVVPAEVSKAGLEEAFVSTVRTLYRFYHELYGKLRPYVFETNPGLAADPANRSLLEGWAKEDARYIIPLATETQFGMKIGRASCRERVCQYV